VDLVTRGTDVIEQVFAQLTTLESISSEQETVLQDLAPYFYYDVWRYPALYISTQTAEGRIDTTWLRSTQTGLRVSTKTYSRDGID